jgi:Icc protein
VVREQLDRLKAPWCAIIGDHDVQQKSFANFRRAMSERTHYAFTVGPVRFVAMNAFDVPHPASFAVNADQLDWVKDELRTATETGQAKVLLLHCYPSDLKVGGPELMELLRSSGVTIIDMGHTHYNEIANDGRTLYSATRSTGQIEEGPVGYSVTNIDGDSVSWRFIELGKLPAVVITSPSDERMLTDSTEISQETVKVRAKFWGETEAVRATAHMGGRDIPMEQIENSQVWETIATAPHEGVYSLVVSIEDEHGKVATDEIRTATANLTQRALLERDQDNALKAWPEHGLLGTQLGPNKNGRKW